MYNVSAITISMIRRLPKLQKASIRFEMCICLFFCPSVRPSFLPNAWNNWSSSGRIYVKLIFHYSSKICPENSSFITFW